MQDYFRNNKKFFNSLGCEHAYQVKDLLREFETIMGGSLEDGQHPLILCRKGQTFSVLWVIEDGYTKKVINAGNAKQAQNAVRRSKNISRGMQLAELANWKLVTHMPKETIGRIVYRNAVALRDLKWGDDLREVVRDLSLGCDMVSSMNDNANVDLVISCPDESEVVRFRLSPPSTAVKDAKTARGLRWVQAGKLKDIVLQEEGEEARADAIEDIRDMKKRHPKG